MWYFHFVLEMRRITADFEEGMITGSLYLEKQLAAVWHYGGSYGIRPINLVIMEAAMEYNIYKEVYVFNVTPQFHTLGIVLLLHVTSFASTPIRSNLFICASEN